MKKRKGLMARIISLSLMAVMVCTLFSVVTQAASKGYVFKYNKVSVTMNAKASALIKKAGKPKSKTETKSCAFKGMDRTYTYNDFILKTYSKSQKGTEYVNSIELLTSKVSTAEGIKIGSTKNQVLKAYGKTNAEFGVYVYEKGTSKLVINVEDGKVTGIRYLAK